MALFGLRRVTTVTQDDPRPAAKPFEIPKRLIWEAWKRVAANKGAPGVDKESIDAYQNRLGQNLYTLWNRMSSRACKTDVNADGLRIRNGGSRVQVDLVT